MLDEQRQRLRSATGLIAEFGQGDASIPQALAAYGIADSQYSSEPEALDGLLAMHDRILTAASFGSDRFVGAILGQPSIDRRVDGLPTAEFLWSQKGVVPFVSLDGGLDTEADGVQLMKLNPHLGELLRRAKDNAVAATSMRSVIHRAVVSGVHAVVAQQFAAALEILESGLVPTLAVEVSSVCPHKAEAEALLREQILFSLSMIPAGQQVMLMLTLPDESDFYADLVADPRVLRVVAGPSSYSRSTAAKMLAQNDGMIASFPQVLTAGLSAGQSDADFDATLDATITSVSGIATATEPAGVLVR